MNLARHAREVAAPREGREMEAALQAQAARSAMSKCGGASSSGQWSLHARAEAEGDLLRRSNLEVTVLLNRKAARIRTLLPASCTRTRPSGLTHAMPTYGLVDIFLPLARNLSDHEQQALAADKAGRRSARRLRCGCADSA